MKMDLSVHGLDRVRAQIDKLTGEGLRAAMAHALNDTARYKVLPDMRAEIRKFDRPTPFIERAPRLVQEARPDRLEAVIAPTYRSDLGTKGGKIGVDPQQVLQAQQFGGARANKRSENVLRRAGILPAGYQTAIPDKPFPGSADAYGNLRGPFVQQLLSYFQAYRLAGGSKNMGDKKRGLLHQYGNANITKRAQAQAGPHMGRRYFVSYGRLRGGARRTRKGDFDERASNLPPGIWAVVGRTGADVRPVLMFVRAATYRPRVDLEGLRGQAEVSEYLGRRLRFRIRSQVEKQEAPFVI